MESGWSCGLVGRGLDAFSRTQLGGARTLWPATRRTARAARLASRFPCYGADRTQYALAWRRHLARPAFRRVVPVRGAGADLLPGIASLQPTCGTGYAGGVTTDADASVHASASHRSASVG